MDLKELSGRVGFGAWQLGNKAFWGDMNEADGIELVRHAFTQGIRFFDTAPGYANGTSEIILGKALSGLRDQAFISSKFGHNADGTTDFRPEAIKPSIHSSLSRLKTDHLDSILLHNPDFAILEGKTDHFRVLGELRKSGLINYYGVSIDTAAELEAVLDNTDVQIVELLFNVFFQSAIPLFRKAREKNVFLVAKVPLDSGWLSGKYDESTIFSGIRSRWDQPTKTRRDALVSQMKAICETDDLAKYALAYILSYPEIGMIIPGIRRKPDIDRNLEAASFPIAPDLQKKLRELYETQIAPNPLNW